MSLSQKGRICVAAKYKSEKIKAKTITNSWVKLDPIADSRMNLLKF